MNKLLCTILLILLATACVSSETHRSKNEAINSPVETSLPEATLPESNNVDVNKFLADPNYLSECKSINHEKNNKQAGYLDVYPGVTHPNQIETYMGKPKSIEVLTEPSSQYKIVNYEKFGVQINMTGDIIESVIVDNDINYPTAMDIILQYGCPDIVYLRNLDEEENSNYSVVIFIYFKKAGIRLDFNGYPISLNMRAYYMEYFIPGTAKESLERFGFYNADGYAIPATWDNAVLK